MQIWPIELCVVVDLGGSKVQMGWKHAPCLTKTRGQALAFKYWEENNVELFRNITIHSTTSVHRVRDRPHGAYNTIGRCQYGNWPGYRA